jgi:diadenosine tetraphosphate (Ap4A) HIT family hydrolase
MNSPAPDQAAGQPPRPLPIRPRPITGESPASYVRRLARANHLRPGYLHRYLEDPGQPGEIRLDWLAGMAGRTPATLQRALTGNYGQQPADAKPSKTALFAGIRRDSDTARGGLSIRALADRHGVHRRIVRQALQSPTPPPRKTPIRTSLLDPYQNVIDDILDAERGKHPWERLSIKAIYEQLLTEHGVTGVSYRTVHRHIASRLQGHPSRLPAGPAKDGLKETEAASADHEDCSFCSIAQDQPDPHLILLQTDQVFAIPAPSQQPARPGQIVVLPFEHMTDLHTASPGLIAELFSTAARITAAMSAASGGSGSTIVHRTHPPGQSPQHLHILVVPGIAGEQRATPGMPSSRLSRAEITRTLRRHLK